MAEVDRLITALPPQWRALVGLAAYAGLRPAGRNSGYVIRTSRVRRELVHVAAVGCGGLSAALALAEHVSDLVAPGRREAPLVAGDPPRFERPWYLRTARRRVAAS